MREQGNVCIALAGNPNCGKTTIFNALTGGRQQVGNYSGVTVERKEGIFRDKERSFRVLDLPGTYSLSGHSPEERIAQDELLSGEIDLLIAVVDSTALSRSLVFVSQLMQLNLPMVLCLNMSDEAKQAGLRLNLEQFEKLLGFPVINTVASRGKGIESLKSVISDIDSYQRPGKHLRLGFALENAISRISSVLPDSFEPFKSWAATKLLLDDVTYMREISKCHHQEERCLEIVRNERLHIENDSGMDVQLFVTESYYGFVDGLLKEVVLNKARENARESSDRIDSLLVHPIWGLPFFFIIVYLLFWLTFSLGQYPMDWLDLGFEKLSEYIHSIWPSNRLPLLQSLITDGIIGGVGGVLVFLPNILILFFGIAFLEDSGYMSRAAYLMDKLMHKVGLHGRSFIPMITGFGCTVPAIMATRTIAGEKERLTTMLILPLMSCGARLPIWLLLVPAFFSPSWRAPVLMSIYVFGVVLALILAKTLRKTALKGADEPFVMELPPYRLPTLRASLSHMFERAWLYVKKAGTIILAVSIILWFLMTFPQEEKLVDETANSQIEQVERLAHNQSVQLENSYAGQIGKAIEPIFAPLGFDWKITTAILGAFAAKEVFVSQMSIVYSLNENPDDTSPLQDRLRRDYSLISAISLIIFLLIASPCMATVAITRKESGRWKWALLQFFGLTAIAYALSLIFYQIASLIV